MLTELIKANDMPMDFVCAFVEQRSEEFRQKYEEKLDHITYRVLKTEYIIYCLHNTYVGPK